MDYFLFFGFIPYSVLLKFVLVKAGPRKGGYCYTNANPVRILKKNAYKTISMRVKLNQANSFKECLIR